MKQSRLRLLATRLLLVAASGLIGCGELIGVPTTIRLSSAAPLTAQDKDIVAARLRAHAASLVPSYTFALVGSQLELKANGAPPEAQIRMLLSQPGRIEARSEDGPLWFSNADLAEVVAGLDQEQRVVLRVKLVRAASERVSSLSARQVGKVVRITLDGAPLVAARVSGPITEGLFEFTLDKPITEAAMLATILMKGPLGTKIESIEVRIGS